MKPIRAIALVFCLMFLSVPALADTLGPAVSYEQLLALTAAAQNGDIVLISGELDATDASPLTTSAAIRIFSEDGGEATIRGLRLRNASVVLNGIHLADALQIEGESQVELGSDVRVTARAGQSALEFSGSGSLCLDPGSSIQGGSQSAGIVISHSAGDFYASLAGVIRGGSGSVGGTGVEIQSLSGFGTLLISGSIAGGSGSSIGGHAVNLFSLTDNAYVNVDGYLQGGEGPVGGHGLQIVSVAGNASIGVSGDIAGGQGESCGGDGLILMNIGGSSNISLSGSFSGGDVTSPDAKPGISLLIADKVSATHARVENCRLQDGQLTGEATLISATPEPAVTPLPEITASAVDVTRLPTPLPPIPETEEAPAEAEPEAPADEELPSEADAEAPEEEAFETEETVENAPEG